MTRRAGKPEARAQFCGDLKDDDRIRVVTAGDASGTYEVEGDTVTWLGGACDAGAKGTYTYMLTDGQFTQTATDEPCYPRKVAYSAARFPGVILRRWPAR